MPNVREKEFFDPKSKIDSKTIDECMDSDELMKWKLTIDGNIAATQMRIDTMKGNQAATGEYADPHEWAKINNYRRVLGFLSQKIQMKTRELNHKQKATNIQGLFMDCARKLLSDDKFKEIYDMAFQLKKANEEA